MSVAQTDPSSSDFASGAIAPLANNRSQFFGNLSDWTITSRKSDYRLSPVARFG